MALIFLLAPGLPACECPTTPPPCEAYSRSGMVFLGTVIEVSPPQGWTRDVRVRIDKPYKGVTEKTLVLVDDFPCDGPEFVPGEQYLIYTGRLAGGQAPVRGCARSRHVKRAAEDLAYLDGRATAAPVGAVVGNVTVRVDQDEWPARAAVVELRGAGGSRTATSDAQGRYAFASLQPGAYTITSSQPAYRSREPLPVRIVPRECVVADVVIVSVPR